jgi:hypothetical protein
MHLHEITYCSDECSLCSSHGMSYTKRMILSVRRTSKVTYETYSSLSITVRGCLSFIECASSGVHSSTSSFNSFNVENLDRLPVEFKVRNSEVLCCNDDSNPSTANYVNRHEHFQLFKTKTIRRDQYFNIPIERF